MKNKLIKDFKKKFHLAHRLVREELSKYPMQMNLKIDKSSLKTNLAMPPDPELGRLALLVQPFADPESPLFFEAIFRNIVIQPGMEINENRRSKYKKAITRVRKGAIEFHYNDEVLDAPTIFTIFAYGGYIEGRPEETKYLKDLNSLPFVAQEIRFIFFTYCLEVIDLCRSFYCDLRTKAPKIKAESHSLQTAQTRCIYCRRSDGDFSTEEHVYPESLGNTEIILPQGAVCKECNNGILSDLDNYLVNHDLIAFLRVMHMPINPKTGKYPEAKSQRFSIKRVGPRNIHVELHGVSKAAFEKMISNGKSLSLPLVGTRPFNAIQFGRCLYKIGIGSVAYHQGPEACLHSRYDKARDFVLGSGLFKNYLLIAKRVEASPEIGGKYQPFSTGTLVSVRIFGAVFSFNLEPEPVLYPLPPGTEQLMEAFPLFQDNSESEGA